MSGMAALSTALTGVKVASTLIGGIASYSAGKKQQAVYNQEADATAREGQILKDEAELAAKQKARESGKFQSEQAHAYASSGITLEGSPLMVLEETRSLAQQEVDALRQRGESQKQIATMRAAGLRASGAAAALSGRNAMFGSVLTAGGTGLGAYISGRRNGIYGTGPVLTAPPKPKAIGPHGVVY